MLDSVSLEQLGTPSATVCTEALDKSAYSVTRSHGIPSYPFSVIDHPIGPKSNEQIKEQARQVVDRIEWLLSPEATEQPDH